MSRIQITSLVLGLALLFPLASVSGASAQDRAVVQRLVQHGQMSKKLATGIVRKVNKQMAANGKTQTAGERPRYDWMRRGANKALFGATAGPGATAVEYETRMKQVLSHLKSGLNLKSLEVFFKPSSNAAVMCTNNWKLTINECDALIASASMRPAALPYLAADDGKALTRTMRKAGAKGAKEITKKLSALLLSVPRSLTNDRRGRSLLTLLEACPGGTRDRETQIRAWHVGPTESIAKCIAGRLARSGTAAGERGASVVIGLSSQASKAFIRWGAPAAAVATTPSVASNSPRTQPPRTQPPRTQPPRAQVPRNQPPRRTAAPPKVSAQPTAIQALLYQGQTHLHANRYPQAAASYDAAIQVDPNNAAAYAGLGAAKSALRDYAGAVAAYEQAARLAPRQPAYFITLSQLYSQVGNKKGAIAALQQAIRIDPKNQNARAALRSLGGEPPPPPLPLTPPRASIIGALQPLKGALSECSTTFTGAVSFKVTVLGDTGEVDEVKLVNSTVENPDEALCMEQVVQGARFPKFKQPKLTVTYPFNL